MYLCSWKSEVSLSTSGDSGGKIFEQPLSKKANHKVCKEFGLFSFVYVQLRRNRLNPSLRPTIQDMQSLGLFRYQYAQLPHITDTSGEACMNRGQIDLQRGECKCAAPLFSPTDSCQQRKWGTDNLQTLTICTVNRDSNIKLTPPLSDVICVWYPFVGKTIFDIKFEC